MPGPSSRTKTSTQSPVRANPRQPLRLFPARLDRVVQDIDEELFDLRGIRDDRDFRTRQTAPAGGFPGRLPA